MNYTIKGTKSYKIFELVRKIHKEQGFPPVSKAGLVVERSWYSRIFGWRNFDEMERSQDFEELCKIRPVTHRGSMDGVRYIVVNYQGIKVLYLDLREGIFNVYGYRELLNG